MLQVRLFGGLGLSWNGQAIRLGNRKAEGLLAYLSTSGNRASRDELVELLWSRTARTGGHPYHSLSQCLYRLRSQTVGTIVTLQREQVVLSEAISRSDVDVLREAVAATDMGTLMKTYSGAFLKDFRLGEVEFETWQSAMQHRFAQRVEAAVLDRLQSLEAEHAWRRAAELAAWLLAHIDSEDAARIRVGALAALGNTAMAEAEADLFASRFPIGEQNLHVTLSDAAHFPLIKQATDSRPVPFVGRRAELQHLSEILLRVTDEALGTTILVIGEPGIGKSRLCERFLRSAALGGARILHGRCFEAESGVPYSCANELLTSGVNQEDLECLPIEWRHLIAALAPGLQSQSGPESRRRGDDQRSTFEAIFRLLRSLSRERPIVLFVDDVQWADNSTLSLLRYCARTASDASILLLVAIRDQRSLTEVTSDFRKGWTDNIAIMRLGELEEEDVTMLLDKFESQKGVTLTEAQRRSLLSLHGNPFFLSEALRGTEVLDWQATGDESGAQRGSKHLGVLAALDQASARGVAILALLGARTPVELLKKMCGRCTDVPLMLKNGLALNFIRLGNDSVELVHDLLREQIVADLSPSTRRLLHHRIAIALEQENGADAGILARHFFAAGDAVSGHLYALEASATSDEMFAYAEATEYARLALRCATSSPQRMAARRQLATMYRKAGRLKEAAQLYSEIGDELRALGVPAWELDSVSVAGLEVTALVEDEPAEQVLCRTEALLDELVLRNASTDLIGRLLIVVLVLSQLACDDSAFSKAIGHAWRLSDNGSIADGLPFPVQKSVAQIVCHFRNRRRGLAMCRRAISLQPPDAKKLTTITWLQVLGSAQIANGKLAEAHASYTSAMELIERFAFVDRRAEICNDLGVLHLERCHRKVAEGYLAQVLDSSTDTVRREAHAFALVNLATLFYEFDDYVRLPGPCNELLGAEAGLRNRVPDAFAHSLLGSTAYELGQMRRFRRHAREFKLLNVNTRFIMGDGSYIDIFYGRIIEIDDGMASALAYLEKAAKLAARRHKLAWHRILLEWARMVGKKDRNRGLRLALKIRNSAKKSGATLIETRAKRVLLELDGNSRPGGRSAIATL